MTLKEQAGGGFIGVPELGPQSSLPALSCVQVCLAEGPRVLGSVSEGGKEGPTRLVAQGLH